MKEQATYLAYAGGWRAVRLMPERLAYATFDQIADQLWRGARALGPPARGQPRPRPGAGRPRRAARGLPGGHALLHALLVRRLPAPGLGRRPHRHLRDAPPRAAVRPGGLGSGCRGRAAAHGQLGPRRGLVLPAHLPGQHRRREARARGALHRVRRLPHLAGDDASTAWATRACTSSCGSTLESGGLVALLADRDLSAKGVDVEFFGETARFPAGPAALAVDTGASLVPVKLFWEGHNVAEILPEIEPPDGGGPRRADPRRRPRRSPTRWPPAIAEHPARLAHAPAALAGRPGPGAAGCPGRIRAGRLMRVGLVCPYAWDTPGGVAAHIHDLRLALMRLGHEAVILAPADDEDALPEYVTSGGKPISISSNGSVAKINFGPVATARARRWIKDSDLDILHVHEPAGPDAVDPVDLGRRRSDRGHVAREPGLVAAGAERDGADRAQRDGEDPRPDRGQRVRPALAGRVHRWRRGAHPQRGGLQRLRRRRDRCPVGPGGATP